MAHNLILGENEKAHKRTTTILTAYNKEFLAGKDGTLSKFVPSTRTEDSCYTSLIKEVVVLCRDNTTGNDNDIGTTQLLQFFNNCGINVL
jgi:hypothetical protein